MRTHALLIAALIAAPAAAAAQDTFEITFTQHGVLGAPTGVILLEADELEVFQCCTITLRRDLDAVAAFQSHQISLVVNRSAAGERVYDIFQHSGETLRVRADRMVPQQSGLVYFYTDGRLIGVTNQNTAQMVIDAGARVDQDGRPIRTATPPVRHKR